MTNGNRNGKGKGAPKPNPPPCPPLPRRQRRPRNRKPNNANPQTGGTNVGRCGSVYDSLCCSATNGIQYPDGNSAPTVAMVTHTRGTITPHTTGVGVGKASILFTPSLIKSCVVSAASFSADGEVLSYGDTLDNPNLAGIIAVSSEVRVTSATVKLTYTGNTLHDGGELAVKKFIATSSVNESGLPGQPTTFDEIATVMWYGRMKDGAFVIPLVGNDEQRRIYRHPNNVSDADCSGLQSVFVMVSGAHNSGQSIMYDLVQNVELVIKPGTLAVKMARPAPARNSAWMDSLGRGSAWLQANAKEVVKAAQQPVVQAGLKVFLNAISRTQPRLRDMGDV